MTWRLPAKRVTGPYGTDYRIGDYVVIKEDEAVVDATDNRDGVEVVSDCTWAAVPAAFYDRQNGHVGVPDAVYEAGTLRKVRQWIEEQ